MINNIFYSLALFPNIQYGKLIEGTYLLVSIQEKSLGVLECYFTNGDYTELIIFTHIDFVLKQNDHITKNWQLSCNNINLLQIIYNILLKSDNHDFNFFKSSNFYNKRPFGTVLSITSKCNIFCDYCFNDYDYPLETRNTKKSLGLDHFKKIIDKLYAAGTRDIILTGGEPFVCIFLWELLDYLKEKNIFIRINTNGTLLSEKTLKRLNDNYVLNLMISIHEFNNEDYFKVNRDGAKNTQGINSLNNFEKKFEKKIIELRKVKDFQNISLDIMTILNQKNIINLEKIYKFILGNFDVTGWHFFRLYSTGTTKGISRSMISLAIAKLYKLNNIYNTNYKIVDSVPFCVTKNTEIAKQVIDGELSSNHNVKTIITTDGLMQIMSAFDTNLGSVFESSVDTLWQGEFVQKMLNNGFLPKECNDCIYKEECRGGSRMDGNIYNGSYSSFDPLGDINNKKINE